MAHASTNGARKPPGPKVPSVPACKYSPNDNIYVVLMTVCKSIQTINDVTIVCNDVMFIINNVINHVAVRDDNHKRFQKSKLVQAIVIAFCFCCCCFLWPVYALKKCLKYCRD